MHIHILKMIFVFHLFLNLSLCAFDNITIINQIQDKTFKRSFKRKTFQKGKFLVFVSVLAQQSQ